MNHIYSKELSTLKCLEHQSKIEYFCLDQECLMQNKYYLCPKCYLQHNNMHKPEHHSIIGSKYLLEEILQTLHIHQKILSQIILDTEQIYENIISKVVNKLREGYKKTRIKLESCTHVQQLATIYDMLSIQLDKFQKSQADIKEYLYGYSTIYEEFKEIWITTEKSGNNDIIELENIKNQLVNQSKELLNECDRFTINIENLNISNYITYDNYELFKKSMIPLSSRLNHQNLNEVKKLPTPHSATISKVLYFENDTKFATCSADGTILLWNSGVLKPYKTLIGHENPVSNIIMLSNGKLASAGHDNSVKIWDISKGLCENTLIGHSDWVKGLVELPNLKLISGSLDATFKFWDLQKSSATACYKTIQNRRQKQCYDIILLKKNVMGCTSASNINIYDLVHPSKPKRILMSHQGLVRKIIQLSDEAQLASSGQDNIINIWNWQKGTLLKTLKSHANWVRDIVLFKPQIIISGSRDGTIKIWNIYTGKECKSLISDSTNEGVWNLTLKSNGVLVSCGGDKSLKYFADI